jgi:hypothetical protein
MRHALGTAVVFGMLGVPLLGLIFTPVFYVACRRLALLRGARRPAASFFMPRETPITGNPDPALDQTTGWFRSLGDCFLSLIWSAMGSGLIIAKVEKRVMAVRWIEEATSAVLKCVPGELKTFFHERRQKRRLRTMLNDQRFPKRFRSTKRLMEGIGEDRKTTERLLLTLGARRSEISDEWTLHADPYAD